MNIGEEKEKKRKKQTIETLKDREQIRLLEGSWVGNGLNGDRY